MSYKLFVFACVVGVSAMFSSAQTDHREKARSELRFVVYLSRHGVRSPTGKAAQYNVYSVAPWPVWNVPPGYLTAHGFHLMELFGAFDREQLASQGLLHPQGCEDASRITFYADSDQRTRETGKALAQGMLPDCQTNLRFLPEGTNDPLFHFTGSNAGVISPSLATAALSGRLGGNPANLTAAYRVQIAALDHILAACGAANSSATQRSPLMDVPATLTAGTSDHLAEYKGPLTLASTLSENLLLEYTEGMPSANVGWGCLDGAKLRSLIDLHTAATDYTQRTHIIARAQASNLLDHIARSLQQAASGKPVAGALSRITDRALFLIGHDTNLENIAGMLNLNWIEDGRRDDTPPGSALIFELWKDRASSSYSVKVYFTAQTLEQMRSSTSLSLKAPPERIPIFVPDCSQSSASCSLSRFQAAMQHVVEPGNVTAK